MENETTVGSFYPLFADLRDRLVIVIGGGQVAERKVVTLLATSATVRIISPRLTEVLREFVTLGRVEHLARPYAPEDLEGAWLVVAATNDPDVQRAVFAEAEIRRIFCNTVDRPDLCSFIVPSTVRRGHLCVAISTGGQSPALARRLRQEMEQNFGQQYACYVDLLGQLRRQLLAGDRDTHERTKLLLALPAPEVLSWMEAGNWDRITTWAVSLCGEGAEALVSWVRHCWGEDGEGANAAEDPADNGR